MKYIKTGVLDCALKHLILLIKEKTLQDYRHDYFLKFSIHLSFMRHYKKRIELDDNHISNFAEAFDKVILEEMEKKPYAEYITLESDLNPFGPLLRIFQLSRVPEILCPPLLHIYIHSDHIEILNEGLKCIEDRLQCSSIDYKFSLNDGENSFKDSFMKEAMKIKYITDIIPSKCNTPNALFFNAVADDDMTYILDKGGRASFKNVRTDIKRIMETLIDELYLSPFNIYEIKMRNSRSNNFTFSIKIIFEEDFINDFS
jgi:hypothetical protein